MKVSAVCFIFLLFVIFSMSCWWMANSHSIEIENGIMLANGGSGSGDPLPRPPNPPPVPPPQPPPDKPPAYA